jgi:Protein of unknown function (DUF3096)
MIITATEISPIVALIAGVLILIVPRLLNIIVAIYLIVEGLAVSTPFIISSLERSDPFCRLQQPSRIAI